MVKVSVVTNATTPVERLGPSTVRRGGTLRSAKHLLLAVWISVGLAPLLLQARSFVRFVTPHKISRSLLPPIAEGQETADLRERCPVEGLLIAGVWWNVLPTHYFPSQNDRLCHFIVPQYNIHGIYVVGNERTKPSASTPASCAGESFPFQHYFYHGSIGYYAFYEEAVGTYCVHDKTAYVFVGGLGTFDINGATLTNDRGSTEYRSSYWYGLAGSIWVGYRALMLRRSYVACKRYGKSCDSMREALRMKDAMVYVQESMRLAAHGANNYQRAAILYLLVEGVMSDLFLLIAQEGVIGRLQYISLGYNLSGVLSMLFEMIETMLWMGERTRCLVKRLLFNYETVLIGELVCAGAMQQYLTSLNRSDFRRSAPIAHAVSHYVWSLVGHGSIVLGCVLVLVSSRALGAIGFTRWTFGSFAVLAAPCCVDETLGVRTKEVMLGGYVWENRKLYYKASTLKAFGILKAVEEDGREYFALHKLHWIAIPRHDLFLLGSVWGQRVRPCSERHFSGTVSMFSHALGGSFPIASSRGRITVFANNRVASETLSSRVAGPSALIVVVSPVQ
ncbi:hypothetical protein BBJ28_00017927 [Nothophytophthora sp. Chile5]|nr:hypothetical protein BBJ28_00017927 [Nothophytophthora sp. Chile5]